MSLSNEQKYSLQHFYKKSLSNHSSRAILKLSIEREFNIAPGRPFQVLNTLLGRKWSSGRLLRKGIQIYIDQAMKYSVCDDQVVPHKLYKNWSKAHYEKSLFIAEYSCIMRNSVYSQLDGLEDQHIRGEVKYMYHREFCKYEDQIVRNDNDPQIRRECYLSNDVVERVLQAF